MEAECSSEMLVSTEQATHCHDPQLEYGHENLKYGSEVRKNGRCLYQSYILA